MTSLKGRPPPPKCNCCPYGFHIDLDFVKFAENIANGNALKQNGERLSSRRISKNELATSSRMTPPAPRTPMSPLESIFSDSLENIVSDFEETFNPRDYNSDRDSAARFEASRNNGYFSDLGSNMNRSLPAKSSYGSFFRGSFENETSATPPYPNGYHDTVLSTKKPPIAPTSGSPSQTYCTALGRTISEIKAKQKEGKDMMDRHRMESGRNAAVAAYRRRELGLPQDLGTRSFGERSSYEQGKTHFLGSKTPELSRKSFSISTSHQSDTDVMPPWRRRTPVQRSSSSVDMDGFASVRRKKFDDVFNDPDQSKPASPFSEWRQRQYNQSPQFTPFNSLPRWQYETGTAQPGSNVSQTKNDKFTNALPSRWTTSTGTDPVVHISEPSTVMISRKTVSSVGTSTGPVPPTKPCSDCPSLKEQLTDLSVRLAAVEEAKNARTYAEKSAATEPLVVHHIGINSEALLTAEKGTSGYHPTVFDISVCTTPVQSVDFAGDALSVEKATKETITSHGDFFVMGCFRDSCNSPIPRPQRYSIGMVTDRIPSVPLPSKADASTTTVLDLDGLIENLHELQQPKDLTTVACSTEQVLTKDCASDAFSITTFKVAATCTERIRADLVERGTGPDTTLVVKEVAAMTAPTSIRTWQVQTDNVPKRSIFISTPRVEIKDKGTSPVFDHSTNSITALHDLKLPSLTESATSSTQTEFDELQSDAASSCFEAAATQTEFEQDHSEPRVLCDSEIAESLWLMPSRDTVDAAVGNDDDFAVACNGFHEDNNNIFSKGDLHTQVPAFNNDFYEDDKVSPTHETVSDPEAIDFGESAEESPVRQRSADDQGAKSRELGQARAAIVKKLLTETKIPQPLTKSNFVRGTATSKSCRVESKKGDSLQYITDHHKIQDGSNPSTPQTQKGALKEKVVLKKEISPPVSRVPDPVPARIPRPKISKYNPGEAQAQSPDEEAEVADRLTPLRSEMRTLRTYANGRLPLQRIPPPQVPRTSHNAAYENEAVDDESSSCSSDSEGSYDTNEANSEGTQPVFEMSEPLREALGALKKNFEKSGSVDSATLDWATKFVQHEWLKTAARRTASAIQVEGFIDALEATSAKVLNTVVNMTDQNENTALHYAVSHGNFDVVSILLDSRVCCLDRANKAGYTAVMLAALCEINDEVESAVIHRLFQMGNVNAKAVQHGQTALMLAVSHGKINTTTLLLQCGADLNIQDEEGSTALMCAAEHGHKEIVKLLLAQPDIDASISDCDSSTALSIAVENGHRDIGVLIYAHLNYGRNNEQASASTNHQDSSSSSSASVH